MFEKKKALPYILLAILAVMIVACGGAEPVEVTRVVTETIIEEIEGETVEVEVTRVVTETVVEEVEAAPSEVTVSAPGELPIVDQPVKMRVMVAQRPGVEDYDTNAFTLWLEKQTGIDLEFEVVPESDAQSKLNVVLASGDLPDVFLGMPFNDALLAQMGDEGLLLPLNDLIETDSVELKRIIDEDRPHIRPLITSPDGNIYGLPHVNECFHCFNAQKQWVYQPWLDELGLELPETTEEYKDMLIAFRDQDPNGNGIADEIPLSGSVGGWHNSIERFLLNSFVYYDYLSNAQRMINQDGTIAASYTQDGYKEGLQYLNDLYNDGLIDPNSFTQDSDGLRQLANNAEPILGAFPNGAAGVIIEAVLSEDGGRLDQWTAVPALEGPSGLRTTAYAPWGFSNGGYVISADTPNPEVALRLADYLYTFDATIRNVAGVKDANWYVPEEGVMSVGGDQAEWQRAEIRSEGTQNVNWNQTGITYRPSEFRLSESAEGNYTEVTLYEWTRDRYAPYAPEIDELIPPLVFTADQAQELADIQLAVDAYVDETQALFITGQMDIDAEWDTYLETLESVGLSRMEEIYQEAYDARMATAQ